MLINSTAKSLIILKKPVPVTLACRLCRFCQVQFGRAAVWECNFVCFLCEAGSHMLTRFMWCWAHPRLPCVLDKLLISRILGFLIKVLVTMFSVLIPKCPTRKALPGTLPHFRLWLVSFPFLRISPMVSITCCCTDLGEAQVPSCGGQLCCQGLWGEMLSSVRSALVGWSRLQAAHLKLIKEKKVPTDALQHH